jgi:hypothetical protein
MDEQVEPGNVTPIAPVQECASCGSRHTHAERFRLEAHNDGCMQPEIRFKRMEAKVADLERLLGDVWRTAALAIGITQPGTLDDLRASRREAEKAKETHGISEASPDTQRSPVNVCPCGDQHRPGHPEGWCERFRGAAELIAAHPRRAHADASAAEPASTGE